MGMHANRDGRRLPGSCRGLGALLLVLLLTLLGLGLPRAALAHRVSIFAWVESGKVRSVSQFDRDHKAQDAAVEVRTLADNVVVLQGRTDASGEFDFPIPETAKGGKTGLKLLLNAGQGHEAQWTVEATELAGAAAAPERAQPAPPAGQPEPDKTVSPVAPDTRTGTAAPADAAALEQTLDRLLDRKLAPLTRMLAEQAQSGPTVHDIVGGLGYIVGIFGLAMALQSRKKS